jgi:predicted nucleic acid-binding protein
VSGFLLDTNVISEAVKPTPDANVGRWFESVPEDLIYLSVMTLGEIRRGIALQAGPAKRAKLDVWLASDLLTVFRGRILEVDAEVAERWGIITATARSLGVSLPVVDALLAATALHHNLTLVTRDAGVPLFNPWIS